MEIGEYLNKSRWRRRWGKKTPKPEINRVDVFSQEVGDSSCDKKQGESFLNWIGLGRNME